MAYPVSDSLIRDAEARLGRSLPVALRDRLTRNNGGGVRTPDDDWELFPVWDPTDRRTMRKTANHIVAETQLARTRWTGFPPEAVAVGSNGAGDLLVLRAGRDEIEEWRHETREVVPATGLDLSFQEQLVAGDGRRVDEGHPGPGRAQADQHHAAVRAPLAGSEVGGDLAPRPRRGLARGGRRVPAEETSARREAGVEQKESEEEA